MTLALHLMIPRWVYIFSALTGLSCFIFGFAESRHNKTPTSKDLDEVVLRTIGHQLLVTIGDDSSRIMPIEKKSKNEYFIRFEKVFSFNPDTLVEIVRSNLEGQAFNQAYIFQVLECIEKEVVYSFSVHTDSSKNLIPCIGRRMPEACYILRVVFQPDENRVRWYAVFLLPFLLSLGLMWHKNKNASEGLMDPLNDNRPAQTRNFTIGQYQFAPQEQCLYFKDSKIDLSVKENELLKLFTMAPNQLLTRDYLLKTIWEDQGVFTGRSLDVFVSRLRKKLSLDPNVKMVGVHGKGYKLQISDDQEST